MYTKKVHLNGTQTVKQLGLGTETVITINQKDLVIEAFKNSEDPLNASKVSEISGVDKKEVDKIVCNKCGKEILVENGVAEADMLSVQKRWGYFSNKDNDVHEFDLCEECYDKLIAQFKVPVEENSATELV